MDSGTLIRRAENALRTGQTENLFPVLANRALEVIREERRRTRHETRALEQALYFRQNPDVFDRIIHAYAEALEPAVEAVRGMWDAIREAAQPAIEAILEAMKGMPELRQSDFALVPQPHPGLTLREKPTTYFPPAYYVPKIDYPTTNLYRSTQA